MLLIKALFIIVEKENDLNVHSTGTSSMILLSQNTITLKIDDIEVYALTWKNMHYIF